MQLPAIQPIVCFYILSEEVFLLFACSNWLLLY